MDNTTQDGDYDLTSAGFDGFMSRSVDSTPQLNLDSPTPPNNAIAFDRNAVSGMLGDTLTIGNIKLNGSDGTIILSDGSNDRIIIGFLPGGF